MSVTASDATFAFPSFYAIVETGLKRMLEFVTTDCFPCVVNGDHFESTVAGVTLISPAVCDILRRDASMRSFVISSFDVESTDFGSILQSVR
jgi:hypothetical protein